MDAGPLALSMIGHNYLSHKASDVAEVVEKVGEVVRSGDMTLGAELGRFEAEFAEYIGVKHAIGVASGTDALFLALKVLGVEGGEVITSPMTFYATVGAIIQAGARPVFADIGADLNIDPACVAKRIGAATRAIVPVHWAGRPANVHELDGFDLPVLEDAAQAVGATLNDKRCGSLGDLGAFSLHPLKNLHVWGDGGVVTTDDDSYAERIRLLRNHGLSDRDTWEVSGYNSRLDTVQAAVARHYLSGISDVNATRLVIASGYRSQLQDVQPVSFPENAPGAISSYHLFVMLAERRDELRDYLRANGVDAKIHYPKAIHLQPALGKFGFMAGDLPAYEAALKKVISLPVHEFMGAAEVLRVCELVKTFFR